MLEETGLKSTDLLLHTDVHRMTEHFCSVRMRTTLFIVCILPVLTAIAQPTPGSTDPVVSLKNGRIRGEYVTVKGTERRVKQYLGIPFARAPVGPLRLAAPQDAEPWEGERDGTRQPPMCIQDPQLVVEVSKTMSITYTPSGLSEDCLYLNVYTPAEAKKGDKLAVMVWIHGGGLSMGAASQYDGSSLAAYENIVMVIIQYRLGILGFLSTGDEHAQGNWGLLDQLAALKWVQENIEDFGGDPQTVTVAGESAGGISASILTLSAQSKGLFQRAIFQSGVATTGNYTTSHPLGHAKIVANITGCDRGSTEQLVQCMREKSQDELVDATKKMTIFLTAVVDGVFLTDTAEELLIRKEVLKVPVMMGITNHEFGWILPQNFVPPGWENGMTRESVLPVMNLFNPAGASSVNTLLLDEYMKDAKTPEDIRDRFTEIMGDLIMTLPVVKVAGYHTDAGAPVYMYEFAHRAELHQHTRPSFVKADHADDVGFMFGGCFWNGNIKITGNITKEEERLCRTMMSYWSNFARTGSPNGPGLVNWPQYDRQKQEYMELGLTQMVRQKLKKDRVHFVNVVLPQKLEQLAIAKAAAAKPGK
ncbi:carboxylesterase 3 isoform X2 [Centropristis striata]|uniref:carboxylesterase 3 isoform X2 n=2 Tax=Centropristis striata TaxID=184440 RepID=UPI0027DF2EE6|nr:carboxylesterase 3 isoform X2 [Centropristis striata]